MKTTTTMTAVAVLRNVLVASAPMQKCCSRRMLHAAAASAQHPTTDRVAPRVLRHAAHLPGVATNTRLARFVDLSAEDARPDAVCHNALALHRADVVAAAVQRLGTRQDAATRSLLADVASFATTNFALFSRNQIDIVVAAVVGAEVCSASQLLALHAATLLVYRSVAPPPAAAHDLAAQLDVLDPLALPLPAVGVEDAAGGAPLLSTSAARLYLIAKIACLPRDYQFDAATAVEAILAHGKPSPAEFLACMRVCADREMPRVCDHFIARMRESHGTEPHATWPLLVESCAPCNLQAAESIVREIEARNVALSDETLAVVVRIAGRAGSLRRATHYAYYHELVNPHGFELSPLLRRALADAHRYAGSPETATVLERRAATSATS